MTPLHILDPNEEARRRQMHADGRTPGEMAAALGITRQAVHIWHQSRGLSANARPPAGPRVEVRVIGPTSFWQRIEDAAAADGKPATVWASERVAAVVGRRDGTA